MHLTLTGKDCIVKLDKTSVLGSLLTNRRGVKNSNWKRRWILYFSSNMACPNHVSHSFLCLGLSKNKWQKTSWGLSIDLKMFLLWVDDDEGEWCTWLPSLDGMHSSLFNLNHVHHILRKTFHHGHHIFYGREIAQIRFGK